MAAELTDLDPSGAVDVVLHWQQWRLRSYALDRVRDALIAAAAHELDQPPVATGDVVKRPARSCPMTPSPELDGADS